VLEEKRQRSVNLRFTRLPMPNAYASKICAGKIKDPSGKKRKDWGPKKAYQGKFIQHDSGDIKLSNQSLVNYYGDMVKTDV